MSAALLWGSVAAVSLVLGAVLGVARQWHDGLIGVVLGFGAGALISSISFELTAEGFQLGGAMPLTLGIATGALAFFFADRGGQAAGQSNVRSGRWMPSRRRRHSLVGVIAIQLIPGLQI